MWHPGREEMAEAEAGTAPESQQEETGNGVAHAQDKTHELEVQKRGCEALGAEH